MTLQSTCDDANEALTATMAGETREYNWLLLQSKKIETAAKGSKEQQRWARRMTRTLDQACGDAMPWRTMPYALHYRLISSDQEAEYRAYFPDDEMDRERFSGLDFCPPVLEVMVCGRAMSEVAWDYWQIRQTLACNPAIKFRPVDFAGNFPELHSWLQTFDQESYMGEYSKLTRDVFEYVLNDSDANANMNARSAADRWSWLEAMAASSPKSYKPSAALKAAIRHAGLNHLKTASDDSSGDEVFRHDPVATLKAATETATPEAAADEARESDLSHLHRVSLGLRPKRSISYDETSHLTFASEAKKAKKTRRSSALESRTLAVKKESVEAEAVKVVASDPASSRPLGSVHSSAFSRLMLARREHFFVELGGLEAVEACTGLKVRDFKTAGDSENTLQNQQAVLYLRAVSNQLADHFMELEDEFRVCQSLSGVLGGLANSLNAMKRYQRSVSETMSPWIVQSEMESGQQLAESIDASLNELESLTEIFSDLQSETIYAPERVRLHNRLQNILASEGGGSLTKLFLSPDPRE